jgi:peptidoglycan/xylan/chitin deacetylase (PgdA/CDA1 family)
VTGALVLTYHAVEDGPAPICLEPRLFERHLDCLCAARVECVTVSTLAEAIAAGERLDGLVAITFDDGFASAVETGWPLLAARGLPATVFCVSEYLGRESDWPTQPPSAPRRPLATAGALAAIAAQGAEIGSHGATHAPLDTNDRDVLERELAQSRRDLERELGVSLRALAWPYGVRSAVAEAEARAAGYAVACTATPGIVGPTAPPFALPRVDAHYVRRPALLRAALRGSPYVGARRVAARARRLLRKDHVAGRSA